MFGLGKGMACEAVLFKMLLQSLSEPALALHLFSKKIVKGGKDVGTAEDYIS
jgi:hypothetical protein